MQNPPAWIPGIVHVLKRARSLMLTVPIFLFSSSIKYKVNPRLYKHLNVISQRSAGVRLRIPSNDGAARDPDEGGNKIK